MTSVKVLGPGSHIKPKIGEKSAKWSVLTQYYDVIGHLDSINGDTISKYNTMASFWEN